MILKIDKKVKVNSYEGMDSLEFEINHGDSIRLLKLINKLSSDNPIVIIKFTNHKLVFNFIKVRNFIKETSSSFFLEANSLGYLERNISDYAEKGKMSFKHIDLEFKNQDSDKLFYITVFFSDYELLASSEMKKLLGL